MSPSRFLLAISALVALSGCPRPTCGPGTTPSGEIDVAVAGATLVFSQFAASPNNDCPDPTAPSGVVSLTITSSAPSGAFFTICTGRPDLLDHGLTFGTNAIVVDISEAAGSCTYTLAGGAASGTLDAVGSCANGTDHAGFAMTVDASAMLAQSCGGTPTQVSATITGTVAVTAP